MASQAVTEQGEAELHMGPGQSSKSPVRPLTQEAKPSCVHTILKKHQLLRVGPKQLCVLAHLGCTHEAGTS